MALTIAIACQIRGVLLACGGDAYGVCQYCGRPFCEKHGVFLEEAQEVCSRKECVAKRDDLARHIVYKSSVFARNSERACGIDSCGTQPAGQCGRCNGYFCRIHVFEREDRVLQNQVRVSKISALCRHCWERRPIWLRT